jgi:threonine synthase
LRGIATIAYELFLQIGSVPGSIIAPVGHGGLLLGIIRGFQALKAAKIIDQIPFFVGVQAKGCSPVVQAFETGSVTTEDFVEKPTIAEGVKVHSPVRATAILQWLTQGKGTMVAIEEQQLQRDFSDLAKRGFYVEPTSALVWSACRKVGAKLPQPIVAILTGSGLKYMEYSG